MPRRRGFTLLEVLVATLLMAIAITGLLGGLRTSLSNAARLTETERGIALARRQMDELLATKLLPKGVPFEGRFAPETTGGVEAGWRALVMPFEGQAAMPGQTPPPGTRMLERIRLEVWWTQGGRRRTLEVNAYRGARVEAQDLPLFQQVPVMEGGVKPLG